MRAFHFKAEYNQLLTPEIVAYLTQIHEYKGQQNLFIEAKADALSSLLEVARIQSTEASNRIEGIITTDDRLKKIVREKTMPQTRSEKEIAGYRDVLATIHESHDYTNVIIRAIVSSFSFMTNLLPILNAKETLLFVHHKVNQGILICGSWIRRFLMFF